MPARKTDGGGGKPKRKPGGIPGVKVAMPTPAISGSGGAGPFNVDRLEATVRPILDYYLPAVASILGVSQIAPYKLKALPGKNFWAVAMGDETGIWLNANWFRDNPYDVGTLVHELVHVVLGNAGFPYRGPSRWIQEGLADHVVNKLGLGLEIRGPGSYRIASAGESPPRPRHGYGEAARFFDWLERNHPAGSIQRFVAAVSGGNPTQDAFQSVFGARTKVLLAEYKANPELPPGAAQATVRPVDVSGYAPVLVTEPPSPPLIHQLLAAHETNAGPSEEPPASALPYTPGGGPLPEVRKQTGTVTQLPQGGAQQVNEALAALPQNQAAQTEVLPPIEYAPERGRARMGGPADEDEQILFAPTERRGEPITAGIGPRGKGRFRRTSGPG